MKLQLGKNEVNIKFGYKPTLKERIISRVVKMSNDISDDEGNTNMEKIEDLLLFLPELILVGMQVYHEDFRYDYETGKGKEEQLNKVFALFDKYVEQDDANVMNLFQQMQEALVEDSFLSKLFQKEQKQAKKVKVEEEKEGEILILPEKKDNSN